MTCAPADPRGPRCGSARSSGCAASTVIAARPDGTARAGAARRGVAPPHRRGSVETPRPRGRTVSRSRVESARAPAPGRSALPRGPGSRRVSGRMPGTAGPPTARGRHRPGRRPVASPRRWSANSSCALRSNTPGLVGSACNTVSSWPIAALRSPRALASSAANSRTRTSSGNWSSSLADSACASSRRLALRSAAPARSCSSSGCCHALSAMRD